MRSKWITSTTARTTDSQSEHFTKPQLRKLIEQISFFITSVEIGCTSFLLAYFSMENLRSLSVSVLKKLLGAKTVDYSGCTEKYELVRLVSEHYTGAELAETPLCRHATRGLHEQLVFGKTGRLINALDRIKEDLEDLNLEFPQIVVVGEENCGKSSVLERIAMLQFFPSGVQYNYHTLSSCIEDASLFFH